MIIKEAVTLAAEELAPKGAELIAEVLPNLTGKAEAVVGGARPALTAADSALPKIGIHSFGEYAPYESNAANTKFMDELFRDSSKHEFLLPQWSGGSTKFVDQWRYGVAPLSAPLETNGIYACTGLSVADRSSGLHYLAHIDGDTSVADIVRSVSKFNFGESSVRVLPGPQFFNEVPQYARGSRINVEKTLNALQQIPNGLKDFKFLHSTEPGDYYSVVSHEGRLYRGAPTPY
ncbi:MAG TPA: hypothetical protein V6C76_12790 [Drouetiella sp.]